MEQKIERIIEQIHESLVQCVIATAGAGSQAISSLLAVPGASQTVLEALIPYGRSSLNQFIHRVPTAYVEQNVARWLAGCAFQRARALREKDIPVLGIGCTATIATNRPKSGQHRAHLVCWGRERILTRNLFLAKGARSRLEEEQLISLALIDLLAEGMGITERLPLPQHPDDQFIASTIDLMRIVFSVLNGDREWIGIDDDGTVIDEIRPNLSFLPGSFNPLHEGHIALAQTAKIYLGCPVVFELSIRNLEKPPLDSDQILERLAQFAGRWPIYLTDAPSFERKGELFGPTTFVVGYDTAERILQPEFYGNQAKMYAVFDRWLRHRVRFLIAGRLYHGRFCDIDHLSIPIGYHGLFQPLPNFREDISSSFLRYQQK